LPRNLVVAVAERLMEGTASTAVQVSEQVLAQLVEHFHADAMSLETTLRKNIELHLRGDIERVSLLLHYLPEVDLWSGTIVAAEALVRWRHPERGLLLPDSFIGVVESTNLAGELGQWMMRSTGLILMPG
jgi:sensor c-di-GMP phosphodiesterase-like protein